MVRKKIMAAMCISITVMMGSLGGGLTLGNVSTVLAQTAKEESKKDTEQ